ncbi:MAG: hypothetical protein RL318_2902, partial [Fibrobacterota bacterium]
MNIKHLSLGLAALTCTAMAGNAPELDGTVGFGIAGGAQRYDGSFGNNTM